MDGLNVTVNGMQDTVRTLSAYLNWVAMLDAEVEGISRRQLRDYEYRIEIVRRWNDEWRKSLRATAVPEHLRDVAEGLSRVAFHIERHCDAVATEDWNRAMRSLVSALRDLALSTLCMARSNRDFVAAEYPHVFRLAAAEPPCGGE